MFKGPAILWNPSIRKFKILPPLDMDKQLLSEYSFGYNPSINNYKIVAIFLALGIILPLIITRLLLFFLVMAKLMLMFIPWVQILGERCKTSHILSRLIG
jgi:hypothetical protein